MLREDKGDMSPTTAYHSTSASPPPPAHHNNDALDDIFGEPAPPPPPVTSSQLDDIFGCSPPRDDDDADGSSALASSTAADSHVSEIPRLRSVHVTAGYREGLTESKARHVQDGFDEGFPLGAVLGLKAGWVLGALEGVAVALRTAAVGGDVDAAAAFEGVRARLVEARGELDLVSVFGREFFDDEGIWRYRVEGGEDEVTFEEVAAQHPLVAKWLKVVEALAEKERVDLGILDRRAREESDDETTTTIG